MKKLLTLTLLVSSSFAQASLWCSVSTGGLTPSETFDNLMMPYSILQLDIKSENVIQIDLTDNYNNTQKVFKAVFSDITSSTLNGLPMGNYNGTDDLAVDVNDYNHVPANDISINLNSKNKIKLKIGHLTYSCEVTGDYQEYYELD